MPRRLESFPPEAPGLLDWHEHQEASYAEVEARARARARTVIVCYSPIIGDYRRKGRPIRSNIPESVLKSRYAVISDLSAMVVGSMIIQSTRHRHNAIRKCLLGTCMELCRLNKNPYLLLEMALSAHNVSTEECLYLDNLLSSRLQDTYLGDWCKCMAIVWSRLRPECFLTYPICNSSLVRLYDSDVVQILDSCTLYEAKKHILAACRPGTSWTDQTVMEYVIRHSYCPNAHLLDMSSRCVASIDRLLYDLELNPRYGI